MLFLAFISTWLFSSGRAKIPKNYGGLGSEISEADNELFIQNLFKQSKEVNSNSNTKAKNSNGKKNQKKGK